ncbi:hypothetical protein NXS19_011710 [Fusarium pseudograminearum]|nr:hypothetical protein NXS19_011710 [Fusarium pseudograminearum]
MAGRPPGGGFNTGHSNNRDDLLLDLDNDQPVYGGGQRSNLNDDDLMRFHEQNQDPRQEELQYPTTTLSALETRTTLRPRILPALWVSLDPARARILTSTGNIAKRPNLATTSVMRTISTITLLKAIRTTTTMGA